MNSLSALFAQATDGGATDVAGGVSVVWDNIITFVSERGLQFGINILAALLIFFIGKWIAKLLTKVVGTMLTKGNVDEMLMMFLCNIVYALLMVLVILAAINRLGIDVTSFAAILAAAGLAVGFALQGSLSNFAAGVMIILFRPFKVGDFVEAAGVAGVVEEIEIFNTIMRTGDNKKVIIPNGQITGGTITNFSAKETRRIDLVVGCGYGDDLKAVKQFLVDLLAADERILKDPEPVVAVDELADSSINFVARPWVASGDYWAVKWDLTEKIKLGFDEQGFNIPFPQQDIHVHNVA